MFGIYSIPDNHFMSIGFSSLKKVVEEREGYVNMQTLLIVSYTPNFKLKRFHRRIPGVSYQKQAVQAALNKHMGKRDTYQSKNKSSTI